MFKFNDLSDKDEEFNVQDHLLSSQRFFEKRRTTKKVYVFDLRSSEDFETSHLPGALNLPFEDFEDSIYQMPFSGEILIYGSDRKSVDAAGEILYDNGFENFYLHPSLSTLIEGVDESFINISIDARGHLLNEKIGALHLIIEPKTDKKANYSIALPIIKYGILLNSEDYPLETISIDFSKWEIVVAKEVISYLEGTEVNLNTESGELEAFNPSMSITEISGSVEEQVQHVLDEEVNPMVASHGGVVSLLEVKEHNAYLEFGGGCQGCGMIDVTLKQGVEVMIKSQIPEIEAIYDVTDHAEGTNPYYQPSEK